MTLRAHGQRLAPWTPLVSALLVACGSAQERAAEPAVEVEDAQGFTVPFDLIDSRVFFDVRVGGQGPFRFVLDTGSTTVLDLAVARQLGLDEEEATTATGAGEAEVSAFRAWVRELSFGEATFRGMMSTVIDLSEVRDGVGLSRLDGALGLEVLQQYVVTIDAQAGVLRFVESSRFDPTGQEGQVELELDHHIPTIRATVDGVETLLWVDIGDRSCLTLTTPFIEELGLRERADVLEERITGWGVGGPIRAQIVRVANVRVGDVAFSNVLTRLPTARAGAFTSDEVGGSLGGGLLRSRRLTFDYRRQRLYLGPPVMPPASADRAGLWLVRREGAVVVAEVVAGGPAEAAGLRQDDRVIGVSSQPGDEVDLEALRAALSDPEQETVELTVTTPGEAPEGRPAGEAPEERPAIIRLEDPL